MGVAGQLARWLAGSVAPEGSSCRTWVVGTGITRVEQLYCVISSPSSVFTCDQSALANLDPRHVGPKLACCTPCWP